MIKKNYLTGNIVYYAEERLNRPHSRTEAESYKDNREGCPFCPENSHMTPDPVYDDGIIRIVPNLYPFLSEKDGSGCHEVVIDTKNHYENICDYSPEHMYQLLKALKTRSLELEKQSGIKYIQIFKNSGLSAGASLYHSHWQIGAQTIVPPKIEYMLDAAEKFENENGASLFCSREKYIDLYENNFFRLAVPDDGLFTYETHIISKTGRPSLTELENSELEELGDILHRQLNMYRKLDKGLCYNICFFSAPKAMRPAAGFAFFTQLIPRLGNMAGFEFSTGCYINSALPTRSAEILKALLH